VIAAASVDGARSPVLPCFRLAHSGAHSQLAEPCLIADEDVRPNLVQQTLSGLAPSVHAIWSDFRVSHDAENRIGHQSWFFELNQMAGVSGDHRQLNTTIRCSSRSGGPISWR
jgi:hypothetical protein